MPAIIAAVPFFILPLYSLYTNVTLILISVDFQCLQNVAFSLAKDSNIKITPCQILTTQ